MSGNGDKKSNPLDGFAERAKQQYREALKKYREAIARGEEPPRSEEDLDLTGPVPGGEWREDPDYYLFLERIIAE